MARINEEKKRKQILAKKQHTSCQNTRKSPHTRHIIPEKAQDKLQQLIGSTHSGQLVYMH